MGARHQVVCWGLVDEPSVVGDWTPNHVCVEGAVKTLCGSPIVGQEWRNPVRGRVGIDCVLCLRALPPIVECCWCGGECIEGEYPTRDGGETFCCKSHRDASVRAVKRFHETAMLARTYTGPLPEERSMPKLSADQEQARADLDRVMMDSRTAERDYHLIVTAEHKGTPAVPVEMRRHIARMDQAMRAVYGKLPRFIVYRREGEHDGGGPRYWAVGEAVPFDARPETACKIVAGQDGIQIGNELHAKLGDWGD